MARERELKTGEEIRDEVQRRFDARRAEMGDDEDGDILCVHIPTPLAKPDRQGCNWVMNSFTGDYSWMKLVSMGVQEVKAIWNLA
ncbi:MULTISPECIES: hypothetical protein [unclassified Variovorax]|uniref:hypothetical protein n=1 Tax=unclassified Variovorax TaxID=663243 RepID=UPI003F459EDB